MTAWQQFEKILDTALLSSNYLIKDYKNFSFRNNLTGSNHLPDKIIENNNNQIIIISKKWQETSGTADEKVMYEIIKLLDLCQNYPVIKSSYILIAGNGWRKNLKNYYLSQSWNNF